MKTERNNELGTNGHQENRWGVMALLRFFALALLASSSLTTGAATLVSQYFPMADGDVRYFNGAGGPTYLEFFGNEFDYFSEYTMSIYRKGDEYGFDDRIGTSTYGYSAARDTLLVYGQRGPIGAYLDFNPAWPQLTDDLIAHHGTRSSRFYAGVPGVTNVAVLASATVRPMRKVTVPAGTFYNCVSVSFRAKVVGRGGVSRQTMVLAPGLGPIKVGVSNLRGQLIGSQSLTGGSVGGVDVRALAARVPPFIVIQPRGKLLTSGRPLRLLVRADGPGPFTYQWYFGNAPIPDATQSSYVLSHAGSANAGDYYVVVSNLHGGSVTSAVAAVTIR